MKNMNAFTAVVILSIVMMVGLLFPLLGQAGERSSPWSGTTGEVFGRLLKGTYVSLPQYTFNPKARVQIVTDQGQVYKIIDMGNVISTPKIEKRF